MFLSGNIERYAAMKTVSVVEYDPNWPRVFDSLRSALSTALGDTAIAIEHVGSTSVSGLIAKPVVDIDIVVADGSKGVRDAIQQLAGIGYRHRGDLGIEGREAFRNPAHAPRHNLYVCPQGNLALRNHIAVRDALRSDAKLVADYGTLKLALATQFSDDIDGYIAGKTGFLLEILRRCGFHQSELDLVLQVNRP